MIIITKLKRSIGLEFVFGGFCIDSTMYQSRNCRLNETIDGEHCPQKNAVHLTALGVFICFYDTINFILD
jgi:hypothetical protein